MQTLPLRRYREKKNTKSLKSSHTRDPLAADLILYLGKDTCPPKTPGNLNGTYNTPNHTQGVQTMEEPLKGLSCVIVWCKP